MAARKNFTLILGGFYLVLGVAFAQAAEIESEKCTDAVCADEKSNVLNQDEVVGDISGISNFRSPGYPPPSGDIRPIPPGGGGHRPPPPGGGGYYPPPGGGHRPPPPGGGGYYPPPGGGHRPPPPGGGGYYPPPGGGYRPPQPPPPRGYFQCTLVASGYSFYGTGYSEYEAQRNAFRSCYQVAERYGRQGECWNGSYYCNYR